MRVCMTVNTAWNVWNFRRPLVRALVENGHEVTVLAPPDDTVPDLERMGCAFVPLEMSVKGLNPYEDARLIRHSGRVFRVEKPDVVLSFTIKNNIFGAMAARSCGIPFIPNVTGLGTAFLSGGLLQRVAETLYRRAFGGLPVVFFQNEEDRDLFVSRRLVESHQARVLPGSGIDLERFAAAPYPPDDAAPIFLMIARLLRDKGVFEYVDAARQIRDRIPGARFQLLGDTGSENRTAIGAETVRGWEEQGLIEYFGATTDMRPFISAAHCIVLPSYREGAPRTLIEAAAMARPLIATDVPGSRSVVRDGVSGVLCQARNSASLATACCRFAALDRSAKQRMGTAGRALMNKDYDEAVVLTAYAEAVREVQRNRSI